MLNALSLPLLLLVVVVVVVVSCALLALSTPAAAAEWPWSWSSPHLAHWTTPTRVAAVVQVRRDRAEALARELLGEAPGAAAASTTASELERTKPWPCAAANVETSVARAANACKACFTQRRGGGGDGNEECVDGTLRVGMVASAADVSKPLSRDARDIALARSYAMLEYRANASALVPTFVPVWLSCDVVVVASRGVGSGEETWVRFGATPSLGIPMQTTPRRMGGGDAPSKATTEDVVCGGALALNVDARAVSRFVRLYTRRWGFTRVVMYQVGLDYSLETSLELAPLIQSGELVVVDARDELQRLYGYLSTDALLFAGTTTSSASVARDWLDDECVARAKASRATRWVLTGVGVDDLLLQVDGAEEVVAPNGLGDLLESSGVATPGAAVRLDRVRVDVPANPCSCDATFSFAAFERTRRRVAQRVPHGRVDVGRGVVMSRVANGHIGDGDEEAGCVESTPVSTALGVVTYECLTRELTEADKCARTRAPASWFD